MYRVFGRVPRCTVTETLDGSSTTVTATVAISGSPVDITQTTAAAVTVTDTYDYPRGAIRITKTVSGGGDATGLSAVFRIEGPFANGQPRTLSLGLSGTSGSVCLGSLPFGTYTVTETRPPDGYVIDPPSSKTVKIDSPATIDTPFSCPNANVVPVTFSDSPIPATLTATPTATPAGTPETCPTPTTTVLPFTVTPTLTAVPRLPQLQP